MPWTTLLPDGKPISKTVADGHLHLLPLAPKLAATETIRLQSKLVAEAPGRAVSALSVAALNSTSTCEPSLERVAKLAVGGAGTVVDEAPRTVTCATAPVYAELSEPAVMP